MFTSECVAFKTGFLAAVSELDNLHRLRIVCGESDYNLTLSTEQLLQIAEAIEWYLFKKEDPAAVLEEILEELK